MLRYSFDMKFDRRLSETSVRHQSYQAILIYAIILKVLKANLLAHWGRVTHICVSEIIKIGSDDGLSLGRRQAVIWTNAGIVLVWHLRTSFSDT